MIFQANSSALDNNKHLLNRAERWLVKDQKNTELFAFLWAAFPILWELLAVLEILKVEHCIQIARENDACMMHSSKTLSYERLGTDEILYRMGDLRLKSIAALRFELNKVDKMNHTKLSLKEALSLRKKPELKEFRGLVGEVIEFAHQGQSAMLAKATQEVRNATRKMSTIKKIGQISKVATYLSVPIGIAEMLLALPPILGLTVSGTSTIVMCSTEKLKRKHSWVTQIR
jgi:hypothetical protein